MVTIEVIIVSLYMNVIYIICLFFFVISFSPEKLKTYIGGTRSCIGGIQPSSKILNENTASQTSPQNYEMQLFTILHKSKFYQ